MSPFDRVHTTSYWRFIVTIVETRVVSEIFNVENVVTLKSGSEVTQGHWKWYHLIEWYGFLLVFYSNFVPKTHRFEIIDFKKCRDLEIRVKGHSRSLEMSPFDRAYMTSYWRSIVTMALSLVISEIFNVEKMSWPWKPDQRSLKVIGTDTYGHLWLPINVSIVTMGLSRTVSEIRRRFPSKIAKFSHPRIFYAPANGVTLGVGHWRKSQKTRMMGLPDGRKSFKIGLSV